MDTVSFCVHVLHSKRIPVICALSVASLPHRPDIIPFVLVESFVHSVQISLVVEAVSSGIIDHTNGLLVPTLGNAFVVLISAVGAWPLSLLASFLSSDSSGTEDPLSLSIVILLALACLFLTPLDSQSLLRLSKPNANVPFPYLVGVLVMSLSSPVFYGEGLSVLDVVFPFWVLMALLIRNYDQDGSYFTPIVSTARRYLEAILAKPESRKIFYFLLLNMCYMLVQMLYGLWTNSLGLISDAIHMAFDCMAIGIGLVASVMAQWKPNERFTYGYTRIETLSGFSNGIFLILISVFIVFEAVQRLMTPPEMNTSQLLLVSSIGLAVNLFGIESASYPISTKPQNLVDHLRISDQHLDSPVTPSYTFDHDEHLEHHHGPSPGHQDTHMHEGHSHNMRGVFLHVMADTLGSVGVIVSTILIQFYGWTGFDPIASLFIAILIAASVIPLVIDTGRVLLLDLSGHNLQIQHATEEVSHISGLSSFTSQFWLKDDNAVMGSVQLELSRVQSVSQNDTGNSQLIVEKVQNIFMDHVSQLQQLNIQIGVYEN
ncbi:hypothetical protein NLI96_g7856 [Meripilus lineatus]|uniref:Cation efflux protein transmembrane domain-containing protein n=1 Tax=Meripilus lineatus TaxID=2056292 RepID=A0AAD5UYF7_9APHY|nr:hypothetical protein NLI96_g7856 [Physisporinus lineatus]